MKLTAKNIKDFVNELHEIDISKYSRKHPYPFLRYCYFYLCTKYSMGITYPKIAKEVGVKHCTVIFGVNKLIETIEFDDVVAKYYTDTINAFEEKYKDVREYKDVVKIESLETLKLIKLVNNLKESVRVLKQTA